MFCDCCCNLHNREQDAKRTNVTLHITTRTICSSCFTKAEANKCSHHAHINKRQKRTPEQLATSRHPRTRPTCRSQHEAEPILGPESIVLLFSICRCTEELVGIQEGADKDYILLRARWLAHQSDQQGMPSMSMSPEPYDDRYEKNP